MANGIETYKELLVIIPFLALWQAWSHCFTIDFFNLKNKKKTN